MTQPSGPEPEPLSLLTFNIGNPSPERAARQLAWLARRPEDVLVLTETRASRGCHLLADRFAAAGYTVAFPQPAQGEYGTMIVARVPGQPGTWNRRLDYLPARAAPLVLPARDGAVMEVVGLYVPSRDASEAKIERKRRFLDRCLAVLAADASVADQRGSVVVLLGDLNLIEPDHQPRYRFFRPFEYAFYRRLTELGLVDAFRHLHPDRVEHSWVGRTGDGYRYDHAFVAKPLLDDLAGCAYVHEPRSLRLSDHSALTLRLRAGRPTRLVVSDPAASPALPSLF
jgi:exodeoxyribonuclease III